MKATLKKELAIVTGISALACLLGRRYKPAAMLGGFTAGMCLMPGTRPFAWAGKSVVITGGSRGLGLALARRFVKEGAKVTLLARKLEELNRARQLLAEEFPNANVCTVVCDVTHKDQLAFAFNAAIDNFGVIDAIVNNAGTISVGPFESTTRADYEATMNLHLYAVIEATQLILPHFRERGGGRIINICSLGGKAAVPHMLPYNASKFALAGFSQGTAVELDKSNIVVTTVYPALMQTGSPIQAVFKGDHEKEFAWFDAADNFPLLSMSPDVVAEKVLCASAAGDTELVLSPIGKLRVLGSALAPELMNAIMIMLAKVMPQGQSKIRQTGAESRALFNKSLLTRPLKNRSRRAEEKYNQTPSDDAEFNMGLH